jgi:phenylalanyl-tRNA synthetase beta chain
MKVSLNWLQNFFDSPLPKVEDVANALTFHAFEIDGIVSYGSALEKDADTDHILDVKVTPNRGHDCLSHRGIAKELSAILKIPLNKNDPLGSGFKERFAKAPKTDAIAVTLEDSSQSPRYIAGYIKGVKVGPSPDWLKNSLEAMGQRSINNIVDATNVVMFNTGQPLHAFDAVKLKKNAGKSGQESFHIVVRKARAGEKLLALDNKEYALTDSMLVIADGTADAAIGIAGIKGGTPASITEQTTDIILESANFAGISVRKTAQALKLRTDASTRFEQVLSPELAAFGMQNAVEMILAIAGGEFKGCADVYPSPQAESHVSVSVDKINKVLGTNLTGAEVADVFTRLGFAYKEEGGTFEVVAPVERLDITIAEDLVEEVGRIVGYDKVPTTQLSSFSKTPEINSNFSAAEQIRENLIAKGYSEVFTSVFADKGERAVLNKVDSVKPFLRNSLVPGLQDALKKNIPNKDLLGLKEIKLFEIGTVWKNAQEILMIGTVSEKEKASEKPLETQGADGGQYQSYPISSAGRYQPFSRYPYIVRDIALWVPAGTEADVVEQDIKKEAGELCVKISLFDQFQKGEKTSYAFRLIFQSFDRTLTEAEVNPIMEKIYAILKAKGFEIR